MNKQLEEYYDALNVMFNSRGWQYLCEDIQKIINEGFDIADIDSEQELFEARGELKSLKWVLSYPEACSLVRGQLEAEDVQDI